MVQKRIDTFLLVHPYLKKSDIPADIVTASGSGPDTHISPQAAKIQVKRVARERKLSESQVNSLVKSEIKTPIIGPSTVDILELNIELHKLK